MSTSNQDWEALASLFKQFANAFPKNDDHFLERVIYDAVQKAASEPSNVTYEDSTIADRPCIWIRPSGASPKHIILFMHGGGFSFGSPQSHRKLAAHLAKLCNCTAVSIDYRLSPEHKFPDALDDCVNAYQELLEQGIRAEHVVVAGDSCGGNLSTTVPMMAMRKGLPGPGAAVSLSPWYDLTGSGESRTTNEENDVLNTNEFVAMLADRYTKDSGVSLEDPLVSPLFAKAEELKGLPPHWISVGGYDMLRDDGVRFSEKLKEIGVEVVLEVNEKQQHVCEFMAGKANVADRSLSSIADWVRRKIGT